MKLLSVKLQSCQNEANCAREGFAKNKEKMKHALREGCAKNKEHMQRALQDLKGKIKREELQQNMRILGSESEEKKRLSLEDHIMQLKAEIVRLRTEVDRFKPRMRFGSATKYDDRIRAPPKPAALSGVSGFFKFWWNLFHSIADPPCHVYGSCLAMAYAPLYYSFGVFCMMVRLFLLSPPFLCSTTFKVECDMPFSAQHTKEAEEARLAMATQCYDREDESGWERSRISSRFIFLGERSLWMETLSIYLGCSTTGTFPRVALPPLAGQARFNAETSQWYVWLPWWGSHLFDGWVVAGKNPDNTGLLFKAEFRCWPFLRWLYLWICKACLGLYIFQMSRCNAREQARNPPFLGFPEMMPVAADNAQHRVN